MEVITIEVRDNSVLVHDGKLPRARLKWQAAGLDIYLVGAVTAPRRDKVQYTAMEACRARHIPLLTLKSYGWV